MARRIQSGILGSLLACASAGAQVPDGWYVTSNFAGPPLTGGLFFVHPRNPGAPVAVTGLGTDLTGSLNPAGYMGANSVLRAPDGSLIVGEIAPPGISVDLHVLTLSSAAVASDAAFTLGVAGSVGGVVQCALLANGVILVGVNGIASGPLAGAMLGVVYPPTGLVLPIPVAPPPAGSLNALAVDPTGAVAFLGMFVGGGPSPIYAVPVPGGGSPVPFASVPGGVSNLAVDSSGNLVASSGGLGSSGLFLVDATGAVTSIPSALPLPNGLAVETVTGAFPVVTNSPAASVHLVGPSGSTTLLATLGLGYVSGVAVNPDPEPFGTATSGANAYSWALAPNSGGLPSVGNAGFSLTVSSTSASTAGWIGFSLLPGNGASVFGASVWIDLATLALFEFFPASGTLPLPIPPIPALTGAKGYFQTFHFDPGLPFGLAATPGLEVTVL